MPLLTNIHCTPTLLSNSEDTWVSKTEKALRINQWIILLSIWANTFSNVWIWEATFITLSVLRCTELTCYKLWPLNFWMSFSSVWDWLGYRWLRRDWWMVLSNLLSLNPCEQVEEEGRNVEKKYGKSSTCPKKSGGKGLATWH